MLIKDDARLHVEATGTVFKWRYKDRLSSEKIDPQILRGAKLVEDDYQKPLVALRNRQGEHYKVTDLLPAGLALDKPLRVIGCTLAEPYWLLKLAFDGQQCSVQILTDSSFATRFGWALEQGLLHTVSVSEGKSEFEVKPGDPIHLKLCGILSDLSEDEQNYQGCLKYIDTASGRSYSLPCLLPRKQLWPQRIDHFSEPAHVNLPVTAQWSSRQQRYEVTGIEPLLAEGEQRLQLVALKPRPEAKPFLLLQSPLPACQGLVFSCLTWLNVIEFEPSLQRPLVVKVEVSLGGGEMQFKAKAFESASTAPFWADVSLIGDLSSGDGSGAQEQEVRIELAEPGAGKLILEQSLKVPFIYHVALESTESRHVPLVFSTKVCGFEYAVDKEGARLEGAFKVCVGDDPLALYLQRLEGGKAVSDLYYRVELKEWLRFGIVGLREGFILECIIENQQRRTGKTAFTYWKLLEIKTDLRPRIIMRQALEVKLEALWGWSCFETSFYADALPDFYRQGAIVVVQPDSEVALALFLSPGLLSKAGYLGISEGDSLTLDYVARHTDDPAGFALVCTALAERPAGRQHEECRARYVRQKSEGKHELELLKPAPYGLVPGELISYQEYPRQHLLKKVPNLETAVLVVRLKRFNGTYQVSKVLNVELSVDV
ncbi:hypothetical protein ALQ04_02218 [Pseudomonas cichorii]|uniref:Uncharacterized protein n=1 Tax=Pseudomonas cichorii TaxID=36746 RepID=A0A3M4LTK4_PSECI|nr:hypothetical protein [Pseudomonas cichorii]RMQ44331.1 hypothetical protein ALQ04_02218 [Pseudomonas cichorii]